MASTTYSTSLFIEKLLAPLPAGEKQANDRKFMRELNQDRQDTWNREEKKLEQIRLEVRASWALYLANNNDQRHLRESHAHQDRAMAQIKRMMLLPAPSHRQMRWKRDLAKSHGSPATEAAFARDEEWLGPIPAPKHKPKHRC